MIAGATRAPQTKAFSSLNRSVALAALLLIGTLAPAPLHAGAAAGGATEWTQLLNNVELAQIAGTEGAILATESEALLAQVQQLATQIQSYQIMLRNIKSLPEQHLKQALGSVLRLRDVAQEAGAIAHSGSALDDFLRSDLMTDPLFERRGLDRAQSRESYTAWNNRWHRSMEAGLRGAGLTLEDVESEGEMIDRITERMGSETGQMQVLQGANQIAAAMARQINDLRALTATQSETVTVAWGRVLSDMDRKEAAQRRHAQEIHETLESLEGVEGRSLNEIFGITP